MRHFFTIIGGMGTEASETFIHLLNTRTQSRKDQDYLDYILVNHATIPDRTNYILNHTNDNPYPYLLEDIKEQSLLNPDFFVIPCNTAHYFYDALQKQTNIPILHMPRETVAIINHEHNKNVKKIGLLATSGTIHDGVYDHEIEKLGYELIRPTEIIEQETMELIYDNIKEKNFVDESLYHKILQEMQDLGSDIIILGCTELSVAHERVNDDDFNVIDSMDVLINASLNLALKQQKVG